MRSRLLSTVTVLASSLLAILWAPGVLAVASETSVHTAEASQPDPGSDAGRATPLARSMLRAADTIFKHVDRENGLSSPIVSAFAEDGEGFLWMGTQSGVARWDGYRMRTYQMRSGEEGSLPDNIVKVLFTDSRGRLWVGTNSGGLVRYDRDRDRFLSYREPLDTANHGRVASLVGDGSDGLWVGTDAGLDHLDINTGAFTHFHFGSQPGVDTSGRSKGYRVTSLVREADGRLWVGTRNGLFQSDTKQGTFRPVVVQTRDGSPAAVLSLLADRSGALWVGTLQGAFVLKPGDTAAKPIALSGTDSASGDERIVSMVEARPGIIWLGTFGNGIVAVDAADLQTWHILHTISIPTSLSDNTVEALYRDRAGSLWVGTHRGANATNTAESGIWTMFGDASRPEALSGTDVYGVLPLANGTTWLGLNNLGIDILDATWKRVRSLRPDSAHPTTALPRGTINALTQASHGKVYIGTSAGLYRADEDGSHLSRVALDSNASVEPDITASLCDGDRVWLGSDNGLWYLDSARSGKLTRAQLRGSLTDSRITVLLRGRGNDLWVGTQSALNRVDLGTMEVEQFLVDPHTSPGGSAGLITSMVLDAKGRLWVGTFGGIDVLEPGGAAGSAPVRKIAEGLPNTNIDTIVGPSRGLLWVSTDDGLFSIDPETFAIRTLQPEDGLAIPTYWTNVGARLKDGTLIFGGVGGITLVQPKLLKDWTYAPPVVITDVQVGGRIPRENVFSASVVGAPLTITPKNNRVTVEFAALDYTAPEKNGYAYRLEGYDKDWIPADPTERVASYTNLPPGEYTLMLRGANRSGVWGTTRELRLRVLPAWYQTGWFVVLAAFLSVLAVVGLSLAMTAVSRRRQHELERQVSERTAELQKLTLQLQDSQVKLEEMAFSDSLTRLPNRRMFAEHFQRALDRREQGEKTLALLMFDIDNFKKINDRYGHDAGDAALVAVAERLSDLMRGSDCLARLGGDEFSILLSGPVDAAGVERVCDRMQASFIEPVRFRDVPFRVSLSIGAVLYPLGGTSQEELYKSADLALYRAKNAGKARWSW